MKRTEIERIERELKRKEKKIISTEKKHSEELTVSTAIRNFYDLYRFDEEKIYNIELDEKILELVYEIQENIEETKWEKIFRESVKKTKIKNKEEAIKQLKSLLA